MTTEEIKQYIIDNKICVVTNSRCMPGTTFLASMKSYINYVPIHNYQIIRGVDGGKPHYGFDAFHEMITDAVGLDRFDYIIYIDDDCFIKNFSLLIDEFKRFLDSGSCMAGPQDGTAICHRNHSAVLFNAFLSFWNIKMIREKIGSKLNQKINMFAASTKNGEYFDTFQRQISLELLAQLTERAKTATERSEAYRKENFENGESPYCRVVRHNPDNHYEPDQTPYTSDDPTARTNAEPYYLLEEVILLGTDAPIYYMFAEDMHSRDDQKYPDNSGLSSVVMDPETCEPIAYHTWYSRQYTKWPRNNVQLEQTKRINKVIKSL